jgi:hypothetical protein
MKNSKNIVNSIATALATMMVFIPYSSYAEKSKIVDLPCCTSSTCPTVVTIQGEEGIKNKVTLKGIRMEKDGEVFANRLDDPIFGDWLDNANYNTLTKREKQMSDAASMRVYIGVKCSGSEDFHGIGEIGESVTCGPGEKMVLKQTAPKCENCETGPRTVIEITKTLDEEYAKQQEKQQKVEQAQRELAALQAEKARIQQGINERNLRIGTIDTRIGANNTRIGTIDTRIGANNTRIGTIDTRIGANNTHIGTIDTRIGAIDTRIGAIDAQIGANNKRIEANKISIEKR